MSNPAQEWRAAHRSKTLTGSIRIWSAWTKRPDDIVTFSFNGRRTTQYVNGYALIRATGKPVDLARLKALIGDAFKDIR